jgi:2-phospho-L-lactate guanylyltransferase
MRACLVPVKELSHAKERLAPLLGRAGRRRLVRAMLADVLDAAKASEALDLVAVVSHDDEALTAARDAGALPLKEPDGIWGLNAALEFARPQLQDASHLLVLPCDVPLLTTADIASLLDAVARAPSVALVPSANGGTNALAISPPDLIAFRFGRRSASTHEEEALRAGANFRRLDLPRLALDVDTPVDLLALASRARKGHTADLLRTLTLPARSPADGV